MKRKKYPLCIITQSIFLTLIAFFCINMGGGKTRYSTSKEPLFAPLEEKEGSYSGVIIDGRKKTQVRNLSFFGHTTITGIRKENDDSFNKLDFAKIKNITVLKQNYESKRYPNKEFSRISLETTSPKKTIVKNLLAPKGIVICGIEKTTGIEKAWWLRKVNKIIVNGRSEDYKLIDQKKRELEIKRKNQKRKS
jgi:hypothetical protein